MLASRNRRLVQFAPQVHGLIRRKFRTSVPAAAVVPATVPTSKPSWNFLAGIFGRERLPEVPPLYEPLPGLTLPPELSIPTSLTTEVTRFDNGLIIASEDTPGPTCTVGIYIDSGSVYESPTTAGASHLLERMAFKSTANRTHFRLIREVEAIGAHVTACASREQMSYAGDGLKTYLPEILELLADSIRNPLFSEWEVKEQMAKVREEVKQSASNPQSLILEALHSAGYEGALGNPLIAPESNLANLNGDVLYDFVESQFSASRIVLAAAGVDHAELKALADPLFSDMPKGVHSPPPPSQYVGGDWRAANNGSETHVALGFELPGGWRNEKDSLAALVLQVLMGGGGSFSAGGPGKGMYSRLYTNVLSKHSEVLSCTFFNSIYNDTGLIGVYATSKSDSHVVEGLVNLLTKELIDVATPGKVSTTELERAKKATIASVLMNLESRVVVAEDIGRQILTYGHRKPPQEFIAGVEALTIADIVAIAQKVMKTPLSMASYGNVLHVPRLEAVAARFG